MILNMGTGSDIHLIQSNGTDSQIIFMIYQG
jgi:hypothetical protein